LAETAVKGQAQVQLIDQALEGNQHALEKLIRRQVWIYNITFRMVANPADTEDITQEILLKMITKLSTYNHKKASFRTWLYRIMVNHVINMRKRGCEKAIVSFEDYFSEYIRLFRDHPFYDPPDLTGWLRNTLRKDKFEKFFHLS